MRKVRQGFQLIEGLRQSSSKLTQQCASRAQGIPSDPPGSLTCLQNEQAGCNLASVLNVSEQRLSALLHDRTRIGRELHDSVLQALYAIGLTLAQNPRLEKGSPESVPLFGGQATDQLNKLIQEIRRMILNMESDNVDPFRLVSELQALSQTFEQVSEVRIRVKVDPAAEEILTGEEARELVTITREALSNCVRHAQATGIVIALRHMGQRVRLSIRDNGTGFDVEHECAKGIGLAQMEHRVRKIGGRLDIQSTVGEGTCISADVYLEPMLTTV
ncbi:MAG: sensor histidine kinase [Nitrospirota bacterium]